MKLVFATNNPHKLEEVSAIVGSGWELVTPASLGITEDIPETQDTIEGNALQKARYIHERTGLDVFADDTGLEVTALGGAPGVRSARYAADAERETGHPGAACVLSTGEESPTRNGHNFEANNRLLLKNLEGATDRSARFRTAIALIMADEDGTPREHIFEGRIEGRIIDEYRGTGGFGYDPVFVPGDAATTFAEMPPAEKNAISHRARAVEKLSEFLHNKFMN